MTQVMHIFLFLANFCYVFYELQYSYIHLYFAMLFCTDIVGVWGLYLIVRGNGGSVSGKDLCLYQVVSITLILTVIAAVLYPEHGLKCKNHYPFGLMFIICFYIIWCTYVFCKLRDPKFLASGNLQTAEEIKEEEEA